MVRMTLVTPYPPRAPTPHRPHHLEGYAHRGDDDSGDRRSVIDELLASRLIVHTAYTHYMEAFDAGGEQRRFDLVGSIVNVSNYAIE